MKDDQVLKSIIGVILVLISLPTFGMSMSGFRGMMGYYSYGGFGTIGILASLAILGTGMYLIIKSFE